MDHDLVGRGEREEGRRKAKWEGGREGGRRRRSGQEEEELPILLILSVAFPTQTGFVFPAAKTALIHFMHSHSVGRPRPSVAHKTRCSMAESEQITTRLFVIGRDGRRRCYFWPTKPKLADRNGMDNGHGPFAAEN